jgi:hypothetical protein
MDSQRWFIEAAAEYAGGRVSWRRGTAPATLMGQFIKPQYLAAALTSTNEGVEGDPNVNHHYKTSHFIDFVLNGYPKGTIRGTNETTRFVALWKSYLAARHAATPLPAIEFLDSWLGANFALLSAYEQFASYFLFNTKSPMPATPPEKMPVSAVNGGWLLLLDTDTAQSSQSLEIPAGYAARLWGIRLKFAGGATATRTVSVGAVDDLPTAVGLLVFVQPGDAPRQVLPISVGGWRGPLPRCSLAGSRKQCTLTVSSDDVVYALAINHGTDTQSVAVIVRDPILEMVVDPAAIADGQIDWDYTFRATVKGIPDAVKQVSFAWDFGDGPVGGESLDAPYAEPMSSEAVHSFPDGGPHTVTVVLYNTTGSDSVEIARAQVAVQIVAPPSPTAATGSWVLDGSPEALDGRNQEYGCSAVTFTLAPGSVHAQRDPLPHQAGDGCGDDQSIISSMTGTWSPDLPATLRPGQTVPITLDASVGQAREDAWLTVEVSINHVGADKVQACLPARSDCAGSASHSIEFETDAGVAGSDPLVFRFYVDTSLGGGGYEYTYHWQP